MNKFERIFAKVSFTSQKKTRIIRQMQRLIHAGMPLAKILNLLQNQYSKQGTKPKEPLSLMLSEWSKKLNDGKNLSDSMHGWITPAEQMIIEAGEQSDNLSNSLSDALEANNASTEIYKTIGKGIAYPLFLIVVQIAMYYMFTIEVVPTLSSGRSS